MTLIDYEIKNYCANCCLTWPKTFRRCPDCNSLIRTKPIKRREEKVIRI